MFGYAPIDMRNVLLDLINSLKNNNYSFATALIKSGSPLDIQDDEGKTALMIAILKNRNDIVDLILDSDNCTNKSLTMVDNFKDSALTLAIKFDRDTVVEKILKKLKYNLYQEIQQEITKCQMDITQLEIEQLTLDFNLESAMTNLNVGINPIDLLKMRKAKLEEDLVVLNDGVSWLDDNMDKLGINEAIKVTQKLNKSHIERLLIRPSSEHVVLKRVSNIKRVLKRPTRRPSSMSIEERRKLEEDDRKKNLIRKRSQEQKKKREALSTSRRMGKYDSDADVSDMDGRSRRRTKSRRRRRIKSKKRPSKSRKSKSRRKKSRSKIRRRSKSSRSRRRKRSN
jgi:hypothetical protein